MTSHLSRLLTVLGAPTTAFRTPCSLSARFYIILTVKHILQARILHLSKLIVSVLFVSFGAMALQKPYLLCTGLAKAVVNLRIHKLPYTHQQPKEPIRLGYHSIC